MLIVISGILLYQRTLYQGFTVKIKHINFIQHVMGMELQSQQESNS